MSNDITVVDSPEMGIVDPRNMGIEEMTTFLKDYSDKRDTFRKWLLGNLVEGIHYGFPPGCVGKMDAEGNILAYDRKSGKYQKVNPKQWRAKPSLYKAGALYLKDLLKLRDEYRSDLEAWKMLGEIKGVFVRTCSLFTSDGKLVGEGTGAYKVGSRDMDENASMKMADKRALVAAIINTLATCADIFTQDVEELKKHDQSNIIREPMKGAKEFNSLVQEWIDESIDPDCPIGGHKLNKNEIKALRAQIEFWCNPVPQSPEDAIAWLKENAEVMLNDADGQVVGVKFARKV